MSSGTKLLAFSASNSRNSINRTLIEHAVTRMQSGTLSNLEVEFVDLNDYEMPIYSIDRERQGGIPHEAQAFFDKIGTTNAIIVSFAEHNGSVTVAWKNIFDWMSRIEMKLWRGKPVVMLAATPGPRAGAQLLKNQQETAPFFGAEILGTLGIGKWTEAWDIEHQALVRPEDITALDALLDTLAIALGADGQIKGNGTP